MIDKKVMERLRKEIGKRIRVEYVELGLSHTEEGVLKKVTDFEDIEIEGSIIPFVGSFLGYLRAIRKIVGENGEVLYENPLIPKSLNPADYYMEKEKIERQTFGDEIFSKLQQKREAVEKRVKAGVTRLKMRAKAKRIVFLKRGQKLIKPELKEEWKEFVFNHTKDANSAYALEVALKLMEALSQNKSPEEAVNIVFYEMGPSGLQASVAIDAVIYFHPRGKEFQNYYEETSQKDKKQ